MPTSDSGGSHPQSSATDASSQQAAPTDGQDAVPSEGGETRGHEQADGAKVVGDGDGGSGSDGAGKEGGAEGSEESERGSSKGMGAEVPPEKAQTVLAPVEFHQAKGVNWSYFGEQRYHCVVPYASCLCLRVCKCECVCLRVGLCDCVYLCRFAFVSVSVSLRVECGKRVLWASNTEQMCTRVSVWMRSVGKARRE